MAKGQLFRYGVLPITGLRGWGDCWQAHLNHTWRPMHSYAQAETRVHFGECGAVQAERDDNNSDAHWGISRGSKGSKGKGVGQPHKA